MTDLAILLGLPTSLAFIGVLVLVVQGVRGRREHVRGLFRRDA